MAGVPDISLVRGLGHGRGNCLLVGVGPHPHAAGPLGGRTFRSGFRTLKPRRMYRRPARSRGGWSYQSQRHQFLMLLAVECQLHPPVLAVVKNPKYLDLAGVALEKLNSRPSRTRKTASDPATRTSGVVRQSRASRTPRTIAVPLRLVSNTSPAAIAEADFLAICADKALSPNNSRIPALSPEGDLKSAAKQTTPREMTNRANSHGHAAACPLL